MSEKNQLERNLDLCLREDRISFQKSSETAWLEVEERLHKAEVIEVDFTSRKPWTRWAVAASVAALTMLTTAGVYQMNEMGVASTNEHAQMLLPDGSEVMLNKNSVASFNNLGWKMSREVNLESGEAFFDVKKGSTFTVETPQIDVRVLGTSFDVNVEKDRVEVSCKTGLVSVTKDDEELIQLTPGMKVTVFETGFDIETIAPDRIADWTDGAYQFDRVSVREVFQVLEKEKSVEIILPTDLEMNYSGEFNSSQPLSEILETICKPLNLTYKLNEKESRVRIKK